MSFENPHAFWLLLLLPLFLLLKVLADARARRAVARLASPRLMEGLLMNTGRSRAWVILGLELLGLVLFTAALARPQYGVVTEEVKSDGRNLLIAMDVSRSMLAADVKPSRLERAKLAAIDLVGKLNKDRVALIQFAGSANVLCPFTADGGAVQEFIESLDTESVALGGSNLAKAILYSIDTFKLSELSGQQAMVIFSDGEELQGEALAAAQKAREANISIICVAVGTPAGDFITDPDSPSGFLRDDNNRAVITKLHADVLKRIADITRGLYLTLDGQGVSDSRLDVVLQKLQRSDMKSKTIETKVDRYQWPLAAGLLSLVAAYLTGIARRHRAGVPHAATVALTGAFLLLLTPWPAQGAETAPDDHKLGDPRKFYDEGDWRNAVFNFRRLAAKAHTDREIDEMQMGRGVASFKAAGADPAKFNNDMIAESMEAFGVALASDNLAVRETAHYNLAGAIFEKAKAANAAREAALEKATTAKEKKSHELSLEYLDELIRQLENSMEHYQEAITINSDNKAAENNLASVSDYVKMLRDIRKEKAEGKGKGKGKGKGEESGEEGEGDGEEGEGNGEGEGQGNKSGKGKGKGGAGGDGSNDSTDKAGGNSEENDKSGAGDKSNKEFKGGKLGDEGKGEGPGKDPGDKDSGGEKNDKGSNKEKGDKGPGNEDGKEGMEDDAKNATGGPGGSGEPKEMSREEALQKLDSLSGKLPIRGRQLTRPNSTGKNW